MAQTRTIDVQPPLGGLDRRVAYTRQRPFTSVDEQNVRADETFEGRAREGSRPGLMRAFDEQLDSGKPIWMLGQVRELTAAGEKFWQEEFHEGPTITVLHSPWSAAAWLTYTPSAGDGFAFAQIGADPGRDLNNVGAVRSALADFNATADYEVTMLVLPKNDGTYRLFCRMDNDAPNVETNGLVAEIRTTRTSSSPTYVVKLISYAASAATTYTASFTDTISGTEPGILKMTVTTAVANTIKVFWRGVEKLSQVITTNVGKRIGFGINTNSTTTSGGNGTKFKVDWFKLKYEPTGGTNNNRNRVIAMTRSSSTSGKVYLELNDSTLSVISSPTVPPVGFKRGVIQAVEFFGKLYFTSGGDNGVLSEFDPSDNDVDAVTPDGNSTIPTKCTCIGVFQSRLVLAGTEDLTGDNGPHVWYMCAFADETNWFYGDFDTLVGRAVAGTSTDQTKIAQPILAVVPISDDYLIFGCISSLWLLRGNPAAGGTISPLSKEIGVVQNMAWCALPDGGIAFMSRDGLYRFHPAGGGLPQSVSREKLPRELRDLDTVNNAVLLAYDPRGRGVHIAITPLETATGIYYWVDLASGAFHPVTLQSDHEPLSMMTYAADDPSQAGVLYGCRDGYVRKFSRAIATDDGSDITSYVYVGPFNIGGNNSREGAIRDIHVVMDDDSGDVVISAHVGDDPESASKASAFTSRTVASGYSNRLSMRARGASAFLKIADSSGSRWAIDSMSMTVQRHGKHR